MGKLLVVDDDEMVRRCVTSILKAIGYDVVEAINGMDALLVHQSSHGTVSLVIMDIAMPLMDGIEATKLLKKADPSVKIILMSGHTEQPPVEARPDAFIPKPFRSRQLLEVIQQVLQDDIPLPWQTREESQPQNQIA